LVPANWAEYAVPTAPAKPLLVDVTDGTGGMVIWAVANRVSSRREVAVTVTVTDEDVAVGAV
jgi:hypothetical protein